MGRVLNGFSERLARAGLAREEDILFLALDDAVLASDPDHPDQEVLEQALLALQPGALACLRPAEPYATILAFFLEQRPQVLAPRDSETRLFLHDLPVASEFSAQALVQGLKNRKGMVLPGPRLAALGPLTPEQAFVTLSSLCFAVFVLFFSDYLEDLRAGRATPEQRAAFARAASFLPPVRTDRPGLAQGPFTSPAQVCAAMAQAGRATVDFGLVDSAFGNVSALLDRTVWISQTGSSLDLLEGDLVACALDGSSCEALTASSELPAHAGIYAAAPATRCILHGHPKFAVTLSLDCDRPDCPDRGQCHLRCPAKRTAGGAIIVPGETGSGACGICHTLPPALRGGNAAIVLGHGLFATGRRDFNEAFAALLDTENACREEYFQRVRDLGG